MKPVTTVVEHGGYRITTTVTVEPITTSKAEAETTEITREYVTARFEDYDKSTRVRSFAADLEALGFAVAPPKTKRLDSPYLAARKSGHTLYLSSKSWGNYQVKNKAWLRDQYGHEDHGTGTYFNFQTDKGYANALKVAKKLAQKPADQ